MGNLGLKQESSSNINNNNDIIAFKSKHINNDFISESEEKEFLGIYEGAYNTDQIVNITKEYFETHKFWAKNAQGLTYFELTSNLQIRLAFRYRIYQLYLEILNIESAKQYINTDIIIKNLIYHNDIPCIELLSNSGIIDLKKSKQCLVWGTDFGFWNTEFLHVCKKYNVSFNERYNGYNILHKVVKGMSNPYKKDFVKTLISYSPAELLHEKDTYNLKQTPFLYALYRGDCLTALIFFQHGSRIDTIDAQNMNILHYIIKNYLTSPITSIQNKDWEDVIIAINDELLLQPQLKDQLYKQQNIFNQTPLDFIVQKFKNESSSSSSSPLSLLSSSSPVVLESKLNKNDVQRLYQLMNLLHFYTYLDLKTLISIENITDLPMKIHDLRPDSKCYHIRNDIILIYVLFKTKYADKYGANRRFVWNIISYMIPIHRLNTQKFNSVTIFYMFVDIKIVKSIKMNMVMPFSLGKNKFSHCFSKNNNLYYLNSKKSKKSLHYQITCIPSCELFFLIFAMFVCDACQPLSILSLLVIFICLYLYIQGV